ncbi:MAG: enoyl-CoA hydratase/isomerase family protein [Myxococcales bacterium]
MAELSISDRGPIRVVVMGGAGSAGDGAEPKAEPHGGGEARLNVLSRALVAELSAEAKRAGDDPSVRAVVLTGAGSRAFCAGANLKERRGWTEDDIRNWLVELHTALRELEKCPKPWIAAVNGLALGGGCELALACDLRVVDPGAQMGLTETRIGIIPGGGGTVRLSRLVGLGRARDLILTARRVPADEALRIGLADRVSGPGGSLEAAIALANEIAANAPLGVATAKAALAEAWDLALDAALERERSHYETVLRSADRLEGLQAFAEKRAARWSGR